MPLEAIAVALDKVADTDLRMLSRRTDNYRAAGLADRAAWDGARTADRKVLAARFASGPSTPRRQPRIRSMRNPFPIEVQAEVSLETMPIRDYPSTRAFGSRARSVTSCPSAGAPSRPRRKTLLRRTRPPRPAADQRAPISTTQVSAHHPSLVIDLSYAPKLRGGGRG